MTTLDGKAFFNLFHEAYEKCFWKQMDTPLSEAESKHFSNDILERTGLVIGWKSIKNYSFYILNSTTAKQENPSTATLDTLARYVRNAAKTDEATRKKNESHFGYWYNYRDTYARAYSPKRKRKKRVFVLKFWDIVVLAILLITLAIYLYRNTNKAVVFTDNFNNVSQDSLAQKGWLLKSKDEIYWNKRNEKANHLTLFTLDGDNYPDSLGRIGIKNLLLKQINSECFSTEIHLTDFIPQKNWQQVGLLLMEDTTFLRKSIRFTLSFNDFFGGYNKPGEILLQAISTTDENYSKPEEIAHSVIFNTDSTQLPIMTKNLRKSALRIENKTTLIDFCMLPAKTKYLRSKKF